MPAAFPAPLRAAILDLDGTLVDTLGDFSAALNQMLRELGQPAIASEAVAGFIGKGPEHLLRAPLAQVGAPSDLYDSAWRHYHDAYRALNGRWSTVYEGAAEGLQSLRA